MDFLDDPAISDRPAYPVDPVCLACLVPKDFLDPKARKALLESLGYRENVGHLEYPDTLDPKENLGNVEHLDRGTVFQNPPSCSLNMTPPVSVSLASQARMVYPAPMACLVAKAMEASLAPEVNRAIRGQAYPDHPAPKVRRARKASTDETGNLATLVFLASKVIEEPRANFADPVRNVC